MHSEMRKLFEHIRLLVESRYRLKDDNSRELPWQSVSAFCFLRFIVPAILHPHLFGLLPGTLQRFTVLALNADDFSFSGLPDVAVQRSLTLIAKVIQSLANLNPVSYLPINFTRASGLYLPERAEGRFHERRQGLPNRQPTGHDRLHHYRLNARARK